MNSLFNNIYSLFSFSDISSGIIQVISYLLLFCLINGIISITYVKLFKIGDVKKRWIAYIPFVRDWIAFEIMGIPGGIFLIYLLLLYWCGDYWLIPYGAASILLKLRLFKVLDIKRNNIIWFIILPFFSGIIFPIIVSNTKIKCLSWNRGIFIKDEYRNKKDVI